ncbi:MAG: ribonuclease H-like domain-containing protein [bacterium]
MTSKVVFDIETIGFDWDDFDDKQHDYLSKFAKTEEELVLIKEKMGLHPLTGKVITIAMYNPDTERGVVYFDSGTKEEYNHTIDNITYISSNEETILKSFWNDITKFDEFITFNGSRFDCPFLILRSTILGIKCTRELMPPRFEKKPHVDLAKVLNFYGELERIFPLDFYCKVYGIKSPKEGEVCGHEVAKYFAEGKGLMIAEYCAGDVIATAQLYKKWDTLCPPPFVKKWN